MSNYGIGYEPVTSTSVDSVAIWAIVSLILAIIGGIVGYFLFIKPEKEPANKYLVMLKDFFAFKKMVIEDIIKVIYLILAIYITLISFSTITTSIIEFLLILIVGNALLRIMFEGCLILIMIWKNTNEINKKLKK